ncbi:hypothetical protein Tco_1188085 [Tanacetum coccineum]
MPEIFWISASKKRIVVFALPRERGLSEEVLVVGLRRCSQKRDTTKVVRSDALERNLTNVMGISLSMEFVDYYDGEGKVQSIC